tara:strand:+ start:42 stop:455 length:414 start_codon:yes stop_codon:yes gene_type:complete
MNICWDIGDWIRTSELGDRERQIAGLTTFRFWEAEYPWAVRVRGSLAAGIGQDVVDAINERHDPSLVEPREKMAYEISRQLTGNHRLIEQNYTKAGELLWEQDLDFLFKVKGFLGMVATTANAIDVTPPAESPVRLI